MILQDWSRGKKIQVNFETKLHLKGIDIKDTKNISDRKSQEFANEQLRKYKTWKLYKNFKRRKLNMLAFTIYSS